MGSEIEPVPPVLPAEYYGDQREGFDRLDGESKGEFVWFDHYRRLGRKRTIKETAAYFEMGRDLAQRAASKHSWVTRARSFDQYLDMQRSAELDARQVEARSSILDMVDVAEEKLKSRLDTLDVFQISPRDIPAWIEVIAKVKRQAVGLSDAPKKIEISGADGGPIEVVNSLTATERKEWLAAIQANITAQLAAQQAIEGDIEDADIVENDA